MYILVIGDIILDINHYCEVIRNAPEANIPVYNTLNTDYILGGAANVAKNIKILEPYVELITVIGEDESGARLTQILDGLQIEHKLYVDSSRKTTQKNRIIHDGQIKTRYDIESVHSIDNGIEPAIIEYVKSKSNIGAIVFSDYGKGLLTQTLCESVISYANSCNILTFVDPKPTNAIKYKSCFCFKSNLVEGQTITGKTSPRDVLSELKIQIQCEHVVLTCGENGIYVDNIEHHIQHKSKIRAVDVTGSGDVVLSSIVHLYLFLGRNPVNARNDIYKACQIANYIAGKGVGVIGNYCVSKSDIDEFVDPVIDSRRDRIEMIRRIHKNIVFTNGCFDIVHSAHIKLLQFAKKHGSILVVGLNSDDSIKRLKGETRPINNIQERCELLLNLGIVDYIIVFSDDTPANILRILRPNIIIKGGDYTVDMVIGREYADETIIYEYKPGTSTTNIIDRINVSNKDIMKKS